MWHALAGDNVLAFALEVVGTPVEDVPEEPTASTRGSGRGRAVTDDPSHYHAWAGLAFISLSEGTQQSFNIFLATVIALIVLVMAVLAVKDVKHVRHMCKRIALGVFWTLGLVLLSMMGATLVEVCTMGLDFKTRGRTSPRWTTHPSIRAVQFSLSTCVVWIGSTFLYRRRRDRKARTAAENENSEAPNTRLCLCCSDGAAGVLDTKTFHVTQQDVVGVLSLLGFQAVLLGLFTVLLSVLGTELMFMVYTTSISCLVVLIMDVAYIMFLKPVVIGDTAVVMNRADEYTHTSLKQGQQLAGSALDDSSLTNGGAYPSMEHQPSSTASWMWATLRGIVLVVPSFLMSMDFFVVLISKFPFFIDAMGLGVANAALVALVSSMFVLPPLAALSHRVEKLGPLLVVVGGALAIVMVICIVISVSPCDEC
jgi:hypothetical protein